MLTRRLQRGEWWVMGGESKFKVSVILPCKNEADGLSRLLPVLREVLPQGEILVVDDGSTDRSKAIALEHGARVISHPYSMGNGAAVKTGARNASCSTLVFMDADGQHDPRDIPRLLELLQQNFDMVVGARHRESQASLGRGLGNALLNRLASVMTGCHIDDLTSGFRAVRARHFKRFLYLLPNGFSYPTAITMAFFRSGFAVGYVPIHVGRRQGRSHVGVVKDGVRFFVIVLKIGALFSPMRLFLPISLLLFFSGVAYYGFTYYLYHRFTNMGTMLFLSSLLTFLIGLISEQISSLHYRGVDQELRRVSRDG
jgi:glycosyltransferase involved in cell wall biosynthesis